MTGAEEPRGVRKQRTGVVVSNKMQKTVVVRVERRERHPVYGKTMTLARKFAAHDEKNTAQVGDTVCIEETRPLSRTKRWRLVEVVARAKQH